MYITREDIAICIYRTRAVWSQSSPIVSLIPNHESNFETLFIKFSNDWMCRKFQVLVFNNREYILGEIKAAIDNFKEIIQAWFEKQKYAYED